jgi:hypothetical protein
MRPTTKRSTVARALIGGAVLAGGLTMAAPAQAQLNGENLLGDMGVRSGTQPEPGLYVSAIYYRYKTDTIKDGQGNRLQLDPTGEGRQTINAGMPLVYYVTSKKLFGANIGMMAVLPVANGALEAPGLGLSETAGAGLSDLYVQPLQLGWHTKRADFVSGIGFFAPTGRYSAGADDNLGKGMWSYEVSGGGTVYLDSARTLSIATTAFWETHSKKDGELHVQDVTLTNIRVGQLMTLEGGVGKTFLHGAASIGAAYYAQWKVTADDLGMPGGDGLPVRHRVWGVGPDVTIPIATKTQLLSLINVRYLWEGGARVKTQGQTFMVTTTFPVGGVPIPARH